MLGLVVHENKKLVVNSREKWEALTCKHKISDKILANWTPYLTALQYINNPESKKSYKRTVNLKILKFLKNLLSGLKLVTNLLK